MNHNYHKGYNCDQYDPKGIKYTITIDGGEYRLCQYCFNKECDKAIKVLEEDWKSEAARH